MKQLAFSAVDRLHKFLAENPFTCNHAWRRVWRVRRWLME